MKLKKTLAGFLFLAISPLALAADMNCRGKVSWLMADHPSCSGNMAFKTEATGGKNGIWMCTKSKEAGSLALTALTTQKIVEVYIERGEAASCLELPHYRKISYIIINPE